jgi:hypothetical protein
MKTFIASIILSSILSAHGNTEISLQEKDCVAGNGLACAKAAYYYKKLDPEISYKFYQKGCELKDESACFNMRSLNPRDLYFKKADGIMSFHAQNISNCHIPDLSKKTSSIQVKEVWHKAKLRIKINQDGRADAVEVISTLPTKFKECAKKVVSNINFPKPQGINPSYDYDLTIMSGE